MAFVTSLLAVAVLGGQPLCPVADDPGYAYTREQPVQVGGSPLYGAARQRRYLDALRGPEGQRVEYKRLGQDRAPDGTILDAYEVRHEGLEKPVTLFLDWYHFNPQKAPRGFTCGQPFNLGPPPVDPFREADDVIVVAFEQGASREFPPIVLSAVNGGERGAIYDRFRLLALTSRAAASAGTTLNPKTPPRQVQEMGTVIVAYPQTCGDRAIAPSAVDVIAANGALARKNGPEVTEADAIAALLPGTKIPAGSVAIRLGFSRPRPNDTVKITYAEPCGSAGGDVAIRLTFTPARGVEMPNGTLPPDARVTQPVLLQALIDHEGRFQRGGYIGGPAELVAAGIEALHRWRAEPARINGAPVVSSTLLEVRFDPPR